MQMLNCWKSPRYCKEIDCGVHGKCVEKVDHGSCICYNGWSGTGCSVNMAELFSLRIDDNGNEIAVLEIRRMVSAISISYFLMSKLLISNCRDLTSKPANMGFSF